MSRLDRERWNALSTQLDRALELAPEERDTWLDSVGEEDSALAADLRSLLAEGDQLAREGFLESGPPLPSQTLTAGQSIGPYTLVSLIGRGGMGSVWLARRSDGRFAGQAAVKVLDAALVGHATEERFRREGDFLARLAHPHVAHLLDAGVSPEGRPYLVLEHVDGQQLDRYCNGRSLGVAERIRLFLDVLDAVAHAHAHMIVHRDIKPSNVLVSRAGRVKLLDFGIAKLLGTGEGPDGASALTREFGRALTPEYAAPEQVRGGVVTTATDVYSLGVLLHELLGGCRPAGVVPRSPADLLAPANAPVRRLSDAVGDLGGRALEVAIQRSTTPERLRRGLQGDLDAIVAKALAKAPEERYASATALADELQRYLNDEPVRVRPSTPAYRLGKYVRRKRRLVMIAAAAGLLAVGQVGFYTARLAAERDRARLAAEKATQVSRLLTTILTEADPYRAPRAGGATDPSLRGILDQGAARVRRELAGQPELEAEVLTVIGGVYQRLAANDKARPLLEEALAIARRVHGPEHEQVAQTLNDLGTLLASEGEPDSALQMLEQALALRRKLLGARHRDVAVTLVELGRVYAEQGPRERAEALFREALAIRREVLGADHLETATSLNDLALLLWHQGNLSGAEALLREALAIDRRALGEEHPDVATALGNLALILTQKGEHAGSEELLRRAVEVSRKTLGERHPSLAVKLNNLSAPLLAQGKLTQAAAVLDEALQIDRSAAALVNRCRVALAMGEAGLAEPLAREGLALRQRTLPAGDWRVAQARSLLGATLTALQRYPEAEASLLEAQSVLNAGTGREGREAELARTRLAELRRARARSAGRR